MTDYKPSFSTFGMLKLLEVQVTDISPALKGAGSAGVQNYACVKKFHGLD
jgi:hypothetical protein